MPRDRLLLDAMLGKLATYLRMCGYDTEYTLDAGVEADEAVLRMARETGRRLLTRDVQLAERAPDAVLVENKAVERQLRELAAAGFDLDLADDPARCGVCNARLDQVTSEETTPEYAPDPSETPVWRCPECGQHFWKGSHWDDVAATLSEVT